MILNVQRQPFQQANAARSLNDRSKISFEGSIQKIRSGMSLKAAKFGLVGLALSLIVGVFVPKSKAFSSSLSAQVPIVEEITQKNIALVDCFEAKSIDLDGDNISDLSHGGMLKRILSAFMPGYNVDTYDVSSSSVNKKFSEEKLFEQLNNIVKKIVDGVKYDAVNISLSLYTPYQKLSDELKTQITPENIVKKQELLRKTLVSRTGSIIQSIEAIVKLGVPVYISSGNKAGNYDVLNASRGAISVGALDKDGNIIDSLANNSDVDRYIKAELKLAPIINNDNLEGFDINSDGAVDISVTELSTKGNVKQINSMTIMGTSVATLLAIKEDLEMKKD